MEDQVDRFIAAFPMLGRRRPEGKVVRDDATDEGGDMYSVWYIEYSIPVTCRLAAIFQDIDYTAPIWANVSALAITMARAVT